jgi:hypothetical protein
MNEQTGPNGNGMPARARPSPRPDAGSGVPALRSPSPERVVNVEIGELILGGFGPADLRPAGGSRVRSGRAGSAHAAEAFRRELARELSVAGPAAEQLAGTIADAVFRQLSEPPPRGGAR